MKTTLPEPRKMLCPHCFKMKTLQADRKKPVWECVPCSAVNRTMNMYGVSRSLAKALRSIDSCQVCGGISKDGRSLHVDHCHETGKIRGVLCSECNKALGLVEDDPGRLRSLADYLEER